MIRLERVSYSYPNSNRLALNKVDLEIGAGQFVVLAGMSGSGKTTILRCMNGLVPHFSGGNISGKVSVGHLDAIESGPNVLSRLVGFVAQNPEGHALLDRVEPEIAFALENAAVSPQEMRVRVEEVLDLLDLTDLRDRAIQTLSGGERQRVAIAAVLALRPQILLLDEPTSQLDPKSAEDVLRSLVRLNEDLGLTVVLAEHRLERVLRYADRLVYMENGRITIDDWVREALESTPYVPPLVEVGRALGWQPLPITVKEGKRFASAILQERTPDRLKTAYSRSQFSSPASPLLEVNDVHYAFNGKEALTGVSLSVAKGEVLAVMGRNGSGKSTLLKCIMGLLRGAQGEISLKQQSTKDRDVVDLAREIGYLPQNPNDLLFAESVREELQITLNNHEISDLPRIDELLDELGLGHVQSEYPRDLSTGQRQRVALGAVTITKPELLLLDEPTRGLDAHTKEGLVAIWRSWLNDGMGLVLVTHDVELVAAVADRVMILSQGEVIAEGPTADILSGSPLFSPQIARLFPGKGWLTAQDALFEMGQKDV